LYTSCIVDFDIKVHQNQNPFTRQRTCRTNIRHKLALSLALYNILSSSYTVYSLFAR